MLRKIATVYKGTSNTMRPRRESELRNESPTRDLHGHVSRIFSVCDANDKRLIAPFVRDSVGKFNNLWG